MFKTAALTFVGFHSFKASKLVPAVCTPVCKSHDKELIFTAICNALKPAEAR